MVTTKKVYENILIEQNKRKAPSILLEDFVYFLNKTITQYINKRYNLYETDQQSLDDLSVIRKSDYSIALSLQSNRYKGSLPTDYLHLLNCSTRFKANIVFDCYQVNDTFDKATSRLTSNAARTVEDNYYFKASYKKPYWYINGSSLEIRSGSTTKATPTIAYIDYLRKPTTVTLTQDQIDSVTDTSQVLEFSDYVVNEITNELIHILFENTGDPRVQTHIPINQSIPQGVQQQK